jgi:hypothetical protein
MTSRIFMFIVGALAVGALMFGIPTVAAQNSPASPGNCPFGGVCPTGTPLALRTGGSMPTQGRNGGLIGVAADVLDMLRQDLLVELQSGKTIADVAQAKKVDPLKIVDAFVAPQLDTSGARSDHRTTTSACRIGTDHATRRARSAVEPVSICVYSSDHARPRFRDQRPLAGSPARTTEASLTTTWGLLLVQSVQTGH